MSIFLKFAALLFGAVLFSTAALACDYCGGTYGGQQVYSCNAGQYDCRYESSLYIPRAGDCGYGCHGYAGRAWDNGCGCYRARVRAYRHGFRDGYEAASYGDDHGGWRDGDRHDDHDWHDGDHHDGHGGDGHDDHHDGDHHDDHHDGDHH